MAQRICALRSVVRSFFALRIAGLSDRIFSIGLRRLLQSEEAWAGPVTTGDLAGNPRQRPPVAAPPFEAIFEDDHGVGLSPPFADELGSGFEADDATAPDVAVALQGLRQVGDTPPGRGAKTAIGLLLNLPADSQHEQVARYVFGRMGAVESSPLGAQGGRIHLFECLELARD